MIPGHHSFSICQGGGSVKAIAQCENSYDQAEADCDDGLAEEDQDTHDTGLHAECGCNSVDGIRMMGGSRGMKDSKFRNPVISMHKLRHNRVSDKEA